ncbi:MAG: IS1096 element passenger TnpR family protein [Nitrososphaerales archaeon]
MKKGCPEGLGNEREDGERTLIFNVHYLGQCGVGFSRKVTRKIEMKETQTLDDLHEAIIYKSFGWDDPHMYSFFFDNIPYSENRRMEYCCSTKADPFSRERPNPTSTKLMRLNLKKGQRFLFIFDFGDDHQFNIEVEGFGNVAKGKKYPLLLEEKGKAPRQYY